MSSILPLYSSLHLFSLIMQNSCIEKRPHPMNVSLLSSLPLLSSPLPSRPPDHPYPALSRVVVVDPIENKENLLYSKFSRTTSIQHIIIIISSTSLLYQQQTISNSKLSLAEKEKGGGQKERWGLKGRKKKIRKRSPGRGRLGVGGGARVREARNKRKRRRRCGLDKRGRYSLGRGG